MAIPVWPPELPQRFRQDGYGRATGDGRLFAKMGQGPSKSRRRYSAVVRPVSGTFTFTENQLARFERFWNEDTSGGSLPFLIIDAVHHDSPMLTGGGVPLTTEAGVPILISAWWLVMFDEGMPDAVPLGGNFYRQSVQLNVMP